MKTLQSTVSPAPSQCDGSSSTIGERVSVPPLSNTGGGKLAPSQNQSNVIPAAKLLAFSLDSVYWYCAVPPADLLAFREQVSVDASAFGELADRGQFGYDCLLAVSPGLRVLVAPESNLSMGLYLMAGPRWLRSMAPDAWEPAIGALLASWGFAEHGLRLSRLDPAADVLVAGEFPEIDVRGQLVSRARKRSSYYDGASFTGLDVGKGEVRFRYYDKTEQAAEDLEYWAGVWGQLPEEGETVARFEWQLRREFLQQFGIDTVADLLQVQGDVMRYLLDWVRFAGPEQGHDNQRPDLPLWTWLRSAIGGLGLGVVGLLRSPVLRSVNVHRLADQAIGLLVSIACGLALNRGETGPASAKRAVGYVQDALRAVSWSERTAERWGGMRLAALCG